MANKSVGLLTIAFGANTAGFDKAMKKAQRSIKKFGASMQRVGQNLTRNVTLPLLGLGIAAVKMASDYEESLNKVKVSFGDTSKSVEDFAKTTLKSFGIAEGSALEMASLFGDMGTSMGLTQTSAAKMSISMVGLAGDLASFKNIRIDIARTALASVFTGETESLKKLGIVMTEANLKQFALEQGITKTTKQMSQAEKVQLRYNFVVSKSSNAMGDYARTSDGVANSTRNLQESFKELGEKFGKLLIPEAKNLIKQLQIIIDQFSNLTTEQKENLIFWGKVIAVVGPLIAILGLLAGAISAIIGLFAGLSAGAVAAVMSAIGLSAIYVYEQFQKFKTAKKHVDNLTGSVKELKDITDKMAGFTWEGTFGEQKKEFSTFGDVKITPENKKEDNTEKRISGITKKMESLKPVLLDTGRAWKTYYKNIAESSSMAAEAQEKLIKATALFEDIMTSAMTSALNSSEGFFKGFIKMLKIAIKQLLVQMAVIMAIKLLLGDASTVKEALKLASMKVLGFADGGLVTGPTLGMIGEGVGTTVSNPEVVAPLDKLKGMIGNVGGNQKIEVFGRISGNDIFISNQRGAKNRLRTV